MLRTERLTLRPFDVADAPRVQQLAGAEEIARNTLLIPHPYPDGLAEQWIGSHEAAALAGTLNLVIDDGELVGAIGLTINKEHDHAEVGYWVGVPYWNRGYATEALREVLRYGFEELGLNRIYAYHFTRNPASGRVLAKAGMHHEGMMRRHMKKWGQYVDVELYGIVREDWAAS